MNYPQVNGNSQNSIQGHGNLQGFNQGNSNPQYNPRENMQNLQGNMHTMPEMVCKISCKETLTYKIIHKTSIR